MLERLKEIAKKHEDLLAQQADPEIAVDPNRSREIAQKLAELAPVVTAYREYSTITDELAGANEIVAEADDDEMREMAEAEVEELNERCEKIEEHLKLLLLPVDPNDRRNVILEIRAGTGGDEAALFAGELLRMYGRYAEGRRWKLSLTDSSDTGHRSRRHQGGGGGDRGRGRVLATEVRVRSPPGAAGTGHRGFGSDPYFGGDGGGDAGGRGGGGFG